MKASLMFIFPAVILITACGHSKPKPISANISKTTVTVNGKKDSVINNSQKNYGNATVAEPCVKCLLNIIQGTGSFKKASGNAAANSIVYNINWVTSARPLNIAGEKVINGMAIDVNHKTGDNLKKLTSYVYNNASGKIYFLNEGKFDEEAAVGDISLAKIRRSCFWGVGSSK